MTTTRGYEAAGVPAAGTPCADSDIPRWTAYLGALVAAWIPFFPILHKLTAFYIGHEKTDMKLTYRHWLRFATRSVWEGELPLWNPYIFCGQPFMPSTHGTLFYPPNWPFLFGLSQPLSISLCIMTQVAILALGTVWYARVRGCSSIAALFAGVIAGMGSLMTCRIFVGHFTILCTAPWIPILFALQEKLFQGDRRYMPLMIAAGACMFMGGHLQYAYYYGLVMTISAFLFLLCRVPRGDRLQWARRQALMHLLVGGIAFLLVAVEALPALDVANNSVRGGSKNIEWLRHFSMPPENLLTMIAPKFFGSGIEYRGRWEWWEACFYVGIPGLALCLTAIWTQWSNRRPSHLSVMFFLMIFLSIAGFLPIVPDLLRFIPGWIMFRGHNRLLSFAFVFAAVLAAQGFDLLRTREQAPGRRFLIVLSVLACIPIVMLPLSGPEFWKRLVTYAVHSREFFNMNPLENPAYLQETVRTARVSLGWAFAWAAIAAVIALLIPRVRQRYWQGALLVAATAELVMFAWKPGTFQEPQVDVVPPETAKFFAAERDRWRSGAPRMINEGTSHRIPSIEGDDIVITRYYNTFVCGYLRLPQVVPNLTFFLQGESPLLDAANFAYIAMPPDSQAARSGMYEIVAQPDGLAVGRRKSALPRAYVVGKAEWIDDDEEVIREKLNRMDFHQSVLLTGVPPPSTREETFDAVPAEVRYEGLHRTEVKAPRDGWLVLADGYYPHWKAFHGEKEVPVYRANSTFRAVRVAAGDTIVFRYMNKPVLYGGIISAVTAVGILLWLLRNLLRNRVRPAGAAA